jgi:uncharacterized membrane protein
MTAGAGPVPPSRARLLAALAYALGLVSAVAVLLVEKRDPFVRFHAMQSLVTFVGVLVAHLVLSGLPVIGLVVRLPFVVAVVGLWIVLMVRAFRGERYHLPHIGDFAEHLLA